MWDYTPRQAAAFLVIGGHRRRREMSQELRLGVLANRADEKTLRATLKDWES